MHHYQHTENLDVRALTVCLNSLLKLSHLKPEDMKHYVLYLDEVASFLEFTHNDTLDNKLKELMAFLMKFVKHAGKVVVSDALVNDNVFTFLSCRSGTTLFVQNAFKKYEGKPAVRLRDENEFVAKLLDACASNQYFLFGCDSCDVVTKLFHKCLEKAKPEDKNKFLLLTADTNVQVTDANQQFKDKFVFYSPKLTFGVDFSVDVEQDVFLYVRGNSLLPTGLFQQTTRCRNLRCVYYYGDTPNRDAVHNNLESLKKMVYDNLAENRALANAGSTFLDENDEVQLVENTFYKLWMQNEYDKDTFETNKLKHYELLLVENGFTLSNVGLPNKMSSKEKEQYKLTMEAVTEELFNEFLNAENRNVAKFEKLNDAVKYLGLQNESNETLKLYKEYLMDKFKRQKHDNVVRLMRDSYYVMNKLAEARAYSYDVKVDKCAYCKVLLVKQLEEKFGLDTMDVTFADKNPKDACDMDDGFYKKVKHAFETKKKKPTTYHELQQLYVYLLKHLNQEVVTSKRNKSKAKRDVVEYKVDKDVLVFHLTLHKFKDSRLKHFDNYVKNLMGLTADEEKETFVDCMLDEEVPKPETEWTWEKQRELFNWHD